MKIEKQIKQLAKLTGKSQKQIISEVVDKLPLKK